MQLQGREISSVVWSSLLVLSAQGRRTRVEVGWRIRWTHESWPVTSTTTLLTVAIFLEWIENWPGGKISIESIYTMNTHTDRINHIKFLLRGILASPFHLPTKRDCCTREHQWEAIAVNAAGGPEGHHPLHTRHRQRLEVLPQNSTAALYNLEIQVNFFG